MPRFSLCLKATFFLFAASSFTMQPSRGAPLSIDVAASRISGANIADHVRVLASDKFEGRAPGTRGEQLTLEYIERMFRGASLKPAYGRSFRQTVPLVESELKGSPTLSLASASQGPITLKDKEEFVAQFGSPVRHIEIRNAKLVFAGFGITAPEFGWDDYSGVDVRDKVVVVLRGDPGTATGDPTLFGGRNATTHSVLSEKVRNAAAHGARAVIFIHDDSAGYPWSVIAAGGLGHTQNFLAPEKREPTVEATFWVSEPAGRKLLGAGGLDLATARKAAVVRGFRAQELSDSVVMEADATTKPITSHNLVALVPGASHKNQCVYFLAHWDHMGRDPGLKGDQIFNGAVDNATGVGTLIEIGRALRSLERSPKRTIVLVATTAEERGLLGSEYLTRHPICPIERTVGAVAIDALFPFGPDTHMTVTGYGSSELEDLLAASALKYGRKLQDDGQPEAGANYRADHYRFLRRGVPGFLAVGGPANSVSEADPQAIKLIDYVQHKYHRPSDEYDEKTWDMRGIEGDARILFDFAWRTANDPRVPNWYWLSPMRQARDEMEYR